MKVILAGYNAEAQTLEKCRRLIDEPITPEVISAAYARVTRDARSVRTLRAEARSAVEEARRSNERIIFDYGHASVAEHAVFNFDITGISRFAVEELEHFRLASYTEKSQRYIRLDRGIVVPNEVTGCGRGDDFVRTMRLLHDAYEDLFSALTGSGEKTGVAREDARYLVPLATAAQLGMTVNARELEYMISRLASHPLAELRALSKELCRQAQAIAPSLIRYPEPTDYFRDLQSARRDIFSDHPPGREKTGKKVDPVTLIDATPGGDSKLAAAILFSSGRISIEDAGRAAARLDKRGLTDLVARTFRHLRSYDSVWREFEHIGLTFQVAVSASCFAQLKRHRMATLTAQPYDPSLGVSIPASIRRSKKTGALRRAVRESEGLFRKLLAGAGEDAASYALTNAHRRRVLVSVSLRELYHFSRLRSDRHAQWEIRALSDRMCALASREFPAASLLLAGKDRFEERWGSIPR